MADVWVTVTELDAAMQQRLAGVLGGSPSSVNPGWRFAGAHRPTRGGQNHP
jgi:hypothetical protein